MSRTKDPRPVVAKGWRGIDGKREFNRNFPSVNQCRTWIGRKGAEIRITSVTYIDDKSPVDLDRNE